MKSLSLALAVSILVLAFSGPGFSEELQDCSSEPNRLAQDYCNAELVERLDGRIETLLAEIRNILNSQDELFRERAQNAISDLADGQKAWLDYLNRNCYFFSDLAFGGTASSGYELYCKQRLAKDRIRELETAKEYLSE